MSIDHPAAPPAWPVKLTRIGTWAVALGVLLAAIAGPLNRFGITGYMPALLVLAAGTLLLIAGGLLTLSGWLLARTRGLAIDKGKTALAIVLTLVVGGYLVSWIAGSGDVPLLHEISTDLESPPGFVAIRALREADPNNNPADYVAELKGPDGPIDVPAAQRKGYPDIQPLRLALSPDVVFARTHAAVRQLGWEVVASVPAEGRIEATDQTFFFGFKDDVVVRITADAGGARVDVRSKSRVGLGDAGTNAKRVRTLLSMIEAG